MTPVETNGRPTGTRRKKGMMMEVWAGGMSEHVLADSSAETLMYMMN